MKISDYVSGKVRVISFIAILCVVLGHCVVDNGLWGKLVLGVFAQWHVPWFYFLSGVMLVYSLERHSIKECLISKTRTLLIPYILWCTIGFIVGYIQGIKADLNNWLGLTIAFPRGNPHLWYLHCLIVFSFFSILVWGCLGRINGPCRLIVFGILYSCFFVIIEALGVVTVFGTPTSPLYFLLGIMLSQIALRHVSVHGRSVMAFYVSLVFAVILRGGWLWFDVHGMNEQLLRMVCVISQILVMWFGYDFFARRLKGEKGARTCPWYVNTVFFIYCFHGFLLKFIKTFLCDNMILTFMLVFGVSLIVARILQRIMPRVYGLLTGGR